MNTDPDIVEESPSAGTFVADDTEHSLDPNYVLVVRLKSFFFAALFAGPAAIAAGSGILFGDLEEGWNNLIAVAWIVLTLFLFVRAIVWPGLVFKRYRYLANPIRIQIRRGVLWREVIDVPRSRIQHTDIKQGPIERQFGLSSLVIHTAGTTSASVTIEGLPRSRSSELRDFLVEVGADDAV